MSEMHGMRKWEGMDRTDSFVLAKLEDFWVVPLERIWVGRFFRDVRPLQRC